ncbi:vWA domain-containing protein [Nocardioides cheoyonin]|uniref:vWA domain-containing protein n=1 Tax=Nocardioides cheoyonin TaxID=3156615 RepID=UPI0032B43957
MSGPSGAGGFQTVASATSSTTASNDADEVFLAFTRALRAAGVPVTQDRAQGYLAAVALVGAGDPAGTYAAGRATLCAGPDDLSRYDQVFEAWFGTDELPRTQPVARVSTPSQLPETVGTGEGAGPDGDPVRAKASAAEVLRHRDVAGLDPAEREQLAALVGRLEVRPPRRRTPRQQAWRRGRVDPTRTLRASLRRMGEPAEIRWRRRGTRPRRVVVLADVSGSMSAYADAVLRIAHRMVTSARARTGSRAVEVFTVGTRLTQLTRAMSLRDADRALVAAGETVPDWSGGTRLGETLQRFLDTQSGLARGAVVVVISDGWERGDATLLGEQMERLHRIAHRVVWVNPHRGKAGYEPVQAGVLAVLPHVDDFLAGHSLATYEELMEVIARA